MTERPLDRPVPRFDAYGVPAAPEPAPEPAAPPPESSHAPAPAQEEGPPSSPPPAEQYESPTGSPGSPGSAAGPSAGPTGSPGSTAGAYEPSAAPYEPPAGATPAGPHGPYEPSAGPYEPPAEPYQPYQVGDDGSQGDGSAPGPPGAGNGQRPETPYSPVADAGYRQRTPYAPEPPPTPDAPPSPGGGYRAPTPYSPEVGRPPPPPPRAPYPPAAGTQPFAGEGGWPPGPIPPPAEQPPRPTAARVDTASAESGPGGVAPPWSTPGGQVTALPRPTDGGQASWTFSSDQLPVGQSGYALFDTETSAYAGAPSSRDAPAADSARTGQATLSRPKRGAEQPWPGYGETYQPHQVRRGRQPGEASEHTGDRTVAVVAHLSGLVTAFLLPLVLFLTMRDRSAFVRLHASEAFNFQLTLMLGYVGAAIIGVLFTGFAILLLVWAVSVVLGIQGALAAETGREFRYPFTVRFID